MLKKRQLQKFKTQTGLALSVPVVFIAYFLQALTSEDSELRRRMESAMSEMGGMASKLTDALKERDALKKEVGNFYSLP